MQSPDASGDRVHLHSQRARRQALTKIRNVTDPNLNPMPAGVRAVATLFALCGIYLATLGLTMLARPGLVSMAAGAPLLFGLELSGPYMFLLTALAAVLIAWGLARLNNLARRAATLVAIAGVVMLVPSVSGAAVMVQMKPLVFGGLGIIIRVMIAWYLSQRHVADQFKAPPASA